MLILKNPSGLEIYQTQLAYESNFQALGCYFACPSIEETPHMSTSMTKFSLMLDLLKRTVWQPLVSS